MNVLARNFGCVPIIVRNVLFKNGGLVTATRTAAFKSELKIKWIKPRKIPSTMPEKSGDGGLDFNVKPQDLINHFDKSKEIQDADEIVKRMFTLEFTRKKQMRNVNREKTLALVKRHKADRGSMESKIAAMTSEIHHLQETMKDHKNNGQMNAFLKELIDKRKKYLKKLRIWDYRRFEWLLEKLNLVYKPNPPLAFKVRRKPSMRLITSMQCQKIKFAKLNAYRAELTAQQASFFVEKAEKLDFIRNEEIACGREPTVTEEEVAAARKTAEAYNNRKRKVRSSELIHNS